MCCHCKHILCALQEHCLLPGSYWAPPLERLLICIQLTFWFEWHVFRTWLTLTCRILLNFDSTTVCFPHLNTVHATPVMTVSGSVCSLWWCARLNPTNKHSYPGVSTEQGNSRNASSLMWQVWLALVHKCRSRVEIWPNPDNPPPALQQRSSDLNHIAWEYG